MRFHVLGVGSIGTLLSHHLRQTLPRETPISLIVKNAHAFPNLRKSKLGIPVTTVERDKPLSLVVERDSKKSISRGYDLEIWNNAAAAKTTLDTSPIHSLLVTLKAPSTLSALSALKPRIQPNSVITLLQNGMGVYEELCTKLWPDPMDRPLFILGTTTHGVSPAYRKGWVKHMSPLGEGAVKWGLVPHPRREIDLEKWIFRQDVSKLPVLFSPPTPTLPLPPPPSPSLGLEPFHQTMEALLSLSNLNPTLLPMTHLQHQLLLKVSLNSIINPLTAILSTSTPLRNGELFGKTPGHRLMRQSAREISSVLTAYLHSLSSPHIPPSDVLRLFSAESLEHECIKLVLATSKNVSSMAMDVSCGRESEINYINGYIIQLARKLDLETPCMDMMRQMVVFSILRNKNQDFTKEDWLEAMEERERRKVLVEEEVEKRLQDELGRLRRSTSEKRYQRRLAFEERKKEKQLEKLKRKRLDKEASIQLENQTPGEGRNTIESGAAEEPSVIVAGMTES
ncbi:hypothetical protein P7C73_g6301, partial [Tremellales sp. Uapishka_1]